MLKIKEQQLGAFSTLMQSSFADRMRPLFLRHFPEQTSGMSEDEVRGAIDAGIAGASSYGIGRERDVERYIYLTFALGFDFDHSVPWAGALLGRSDMSPDWWAINKRAFEIAQDTIYAA